MKIDVDYGALITSVLAKVKQEQNKLKHVNILIAGKTGVGKSTLINAAFRENLAETGSGRPVTKEIQLIEKADVPLKIYDTVGLELDRRSQRKTLKSIKKLIADKRKSGDPDDAIHCMWYCVSAPSDRFELIEEEFIAEIAAENIPVILVLTKVFVKRSADELEKNILAQGPDIFGCVQVLAQGDEKNPAFGVKELVEETCELLPTAIQQAFTNAQRVSLELKRKKSNKIITASVAATFGEGLLPIPLADAPIMIATQTSMLAKITTVYGIDLEKKKIETIAASIIGIAMATLAGKTVASSFLKLIPGPGALLGGAISGGVAGAVTTALGKTYIQIMELVLAGKIDLNSLTQNELTELFKKMLAKYAKDQGFLK